MTPGPLAAVKWGKDAQDLWHVSWDLTLVTVSKNVTSVALTLTYVPTSGRSFDNFVIRGFDPADPWTSSVNPSLPGAAQFTASATHGAYAPNSTYYIHNDFAGTQNNSAGTVQAKGTITYSDNSTSPVNVGPVSWSSGNAHPANH